jgi:beta-mannosidase
MTVIDLSGNWALRSVDGAHAATLKLPGDAISALRDAGVIPDPFIGMNEEACRWVCDLDWAATRSFELPADQPMDGWHLDIDNLDTIATIAINGREVLKARNCFRRYRPDVDKALRPGRNEIAITFHSSVKAAAAEQARQPFFIPWHTGNCAIPHGNMLRKPQCHFGWDWNLAVPPFGVYGAIALKRMDFGRIEAVKAEQTHADGVVTVEVATEVWVRKTRRAPITVTLGGQSVTDAIDWAEGRNWHRARFTIEDAKPWQPAGSGGQPLYDLDVALEGETQHRRIGLRRIELVATPDEAGSRFGFKVNGREVFCRGANWIPADALPSAATPERVETLLRAAAAANMNMIRVWGGGFYESERFYDLCDELGLLVWQDAMFSCHLYPSTPDFLEEVREELAYQARRLQHHACLALWCGDNELVGALTWFPASIKDRDRYLVNYDRLNRAIEETIRSVDPGCAWHPSSPSHGPLSFGDAWHGDGAGDMHFWSVWHEGRPFEHYRDVKPRFCSEFGFQSYPSMNVIRRFAEPADWNISAPVFEAHQKNAGGNARITETMFRNFRFPKDFPNFVYLSQIQHGLAMKTAVDFWRSLKPHCMGTLYWQLNDTWPVCSWSGLDHGGDWKLMHHMARRFFEPVTVAAIPSEDGALVRFVAVNDRPETERISLVVEAVALSGARRRILEAEAETGPDAAATIGEIALAALRPDEFIRFAFEAGETSGADSCWPRPIKTFALEDPGLTVVAKDGRFLIRAERPAFFIALEAPQAGHFSDNAFDLMAGEERRIDFRDHEGMRPALADITIRHLRSSFV